MAGMGGLHISKEQGEGVDGKWGRDSRAWREGLIGERGGRGNWDWA